MADPFSPDEAVFWFYCCYQFPKLTYSSMKGYLTAIRGTYLDNGFADPFMNMSKLERLLLGYKKAKHKRRRKKRQPVTVALLKKMERHFNFNKASDRVLWALLVIGVYGLLRLGEITGQSANGNHGEYAVPREHMKKLQVEWVDDFHFKIKIPASKTDVFSEGVSVSYHANGSRTCPVKAMKRVLPRDATRDSSPLFARRGGKAWTRGAVVAALHEKLKLAGVSTEGFTGHSLRRGGCQTLFEAGVPHWIIQAMGRWRSWCFKLYLDLERNVDLYRSISSKMSGE
jgi:hypothetical protein